MTHAKQDSSKKHRMLWILGLIVAAFCLIVAGDALINKLGSSTEEALPDSDRRALHELSIYTAAENDGDQAWKGISVTDHPILVMSKESGYSYLVNPETPVRSLFATNITMRDNPGGLDVHRLSRLYPRLWGIKALGGSFNTIGETTTVLGNDVYYLRFDDSNLNADYSSEHFIAFLAHESFHYYGQNHWPASSRFLEELRDDDYRLMSDKLALLDEVRAVTDAESPDEDRLRELATQLVALEEQRLAANPAYVSAEQGMETIEGTAEYMGMAAADSVGYDYGVMYFDNTKDVPFADVLPMYRAGKLGEGFLRDRLPYETGAQLALLAHELDPDGGWQDYLNEQSLEQPRTLIGALEHVLAG
ncbi:hypothetical protein [Corynebacterium uterequi]|uniref:Uncharacterized protein n=1 Tax=Corynebacterium uterequi TaxID=1072256 RepID=A0A0G3HJ66_9CORY|nr:hypothetical protein [Corynebacterium uterequi]AKK11998.1 hypothetical protein CUTER_10155 [Corynebacterium uterequi]